VTTTEVRLSKKPSLVDFAATQRGPGCKLCSLPERAEFDQARRDGVPGTVVRRWLIEACGYMEEQVTRNGVEQHFQQKHHES
jgi:hypothetical protein